MLSLPRKRKYTECDLLGRYDVLIHMHSCAGHAGYALGMDSNNPARHHSEDEAKALDQRTSRVIQGHPWIRDVPYMPRLEAKMDKVYEFVHEALQELRDLKVGAMKCSGCDAEEMDSEGCIGVCS